VLVEDWRALALDIGGDGVRTIPDALRAHAHPQPVTIASPTRPGHPLEASQTMLIETLPAVLVVHLKRFMYDRAVGDVVKVGKKVAYERELEIGPGA
jgi:ubiquitin carboxyl-terminal hydrolase 10